MAPLSFLGLPNSIPMRLDPSASHLARFASLERQKYLVCKPLFLLMPWKRAGLARLPPVCGLVNDVRTLYINRDPELLKLIQSIEATEKLVPDYLKKAA